MKLNYFTGENQSDLPFFFKFRAVLDKILYITRGIKHITGNSCDYR
jgi:hypothetical protein